MGVKTCTFPIEKNCDGGADRPQRYAVATRVTGGFRDSGDEKRHDEREDCHSEPVEPDPGDAVGKGDRGGNAAEPESRPPRSQRQSGDQCRQYEPASRHPTTLLLPPEAGSPML